MSTGASKSLKKKINPLLPVEKILSSQIDQARFIKILSDDADGFMSRASRKFGCSVRTVQRRISEFPVFNEAIKSIQEAHRQKRLDELEKVSYEEAKLPENFRERKFYLEALDPSRFRSTHRDIGPANIQINFGYTVPENRYGMNSPIKDEDIEDGEVFAEESGEMDNGIDKIDFGNIQ
ncbi:MAG: hypothetical protein H8D23_11915 [Candidatus Brocadiales bacterium]|nr:hypothetical protein [Candidatus Brocadiales bacterium]MBL7110152.1 hypothetical protein [Candidatus Neomarinimicrobiota bacterium]